MIGASSHQPRQPVGSSSFTLRNMATIPQKELRNNVAAVLRRAEAGEELTVTVSGRPVARLGPETSTRRWVGGAALREVFGSAAPQGLADDLEQMPGELVDPFA